VAELSIKCLDSLATATYHNCKYIYALFVEI
jgi:hypothetical protein